MIRVVVVDDQGLVRAGLSSILATQPDIEVVGEAGDGAEAVRVEYAGVGGEDVPRRAAGPQLRLAGPERLARGPVVGAVQRPRAPDHGRAPENPG